METQTQASSGSTFLVSIAGLGASEEDDISERDEEILASEIDPIRGWGLKQDNSHYSHFDSGSPRFYDNPSPAQPLF